MPGYVALPSPRRSLPPSLLPGRTRTPGQSCPCRSFSTSRRHRSAAGHTAVARTPLPPGRCHGCGPARRRSINSGHALCVPEGARREYANLLVLPKDEKVLVAGDNQSPPRHRQKPAQAPSRRHGHGRRDCARVVERPVSRPSGGTCPPPQRDFRAGGSCGEGCRSPHGRDGCSEAKCADEGAAPRRTDTTLAPRKQR